MKKYLVALLLVIVVSVGCTKVDEPIEINLVKTYSPIEDDFDYSRLVSVPFEDSYYLEKGIVIPKEAVDDSFHTKPMGEINPYYGKSFSVYKDNSNQSNNNFYSTFDLSKINIINKLSTSRNAIYFIDVENTGEGWKTRFYSTEDNYYEQISSERFAFIDAIESNGIFSYFIDKETITAVKWDNLIYAMYNDASLQYSVYLSNDGIYLISKNPKFERSALNLDTKPGVILFKS